MSFLDKKKFHVNIYQNKLKVFEAERKKKEDEEKEKECIRELKQQQEMINSIGEIEGKELKNQLDTSFLYQPPPGYINTDNKNKTVEKKNENEIQKDVKKNDSKDQKEKQNEMKPKKESIQKKFKFKK